MYVLLLWHGALRFLALFSFVQHLAESVLISSASKLWSTASILVEIRRRMPLWRPFWRRALDRFIEFFDHFIEWSDVELRFEEWIVCSLFHGRSEFGQCFCKQGRRDRHAPLEASIPARRRRCGILASVRPIESLCWFGSGFILGWFGFDACWQWQLM